MRISDWSSDVCSSDLLRRLAPETLRVVERAPVYRVEPAGHACPPCIREKLLRRMPPTMEGGMAPSPIIGSPTALQRARCGGIAANEGRSEEHTSELQSLMRISYAVFCLKKKNNKTR